MWIVAIQWDDYESSIKEFDNEVEAQEYYSVWEVESHASIYLAEVKKANRRVQEG
ncbi:hypothetical protein J22TS1_43950 [Siminovitchia terrae]|uniref:hypothetical protein n=1 Tax=Siminovitchia terrae TaxID=1914933 RepID=UPI001B0B6DC6|nr:hypothetical protein [Siminovitchia terrae]GIN93344.1 hypothetical protein J22TS1_43950 [Siminovitchia terrae]